MSCILKSRFLFTAARPNPYLYVSGPVCTHPYASDSYATKVEPV